MAITIALKNVTVQTRSIVYWICIFVMVKYIAKMGLTSLKISVAVSKMYIFTCTCYLI